MDNNVNELFSLPIKTRQVAEIEGVPLYTSDSLIKATLKTIEKAGASSNYYPQLEKMVNEGILVPCFLTKGIFSWVRRNLFRIKVDFGDAFAFYYFPDRKVYILMDNNMSKWGTAKNEEVAQTVVHECMHLIANRKPKGFYKAFNPYLIKYYSEVFHLLFNIKKPNSKDVSEIISFIRKEFRSTKPINKVLTSYSELLENKFGKQTSFDEEKFKEFVLHYIVFCKYGIIGNVSALEMAARKYREVIASLYYAYGRAFNKKPNLINQYQEMFDPTEVASQYSEMFPKSSVVKKIFRLI